MDASTRNRSLAAGVVCALALSAAALPAADGQAGLGSMLPGAGKSAAKATAKADSQFAVARICERRGETEKAQELYQELAKKSPPKVKAAALHRLGVIAAKSGTLPVAEGYFKQAAAIAPDDPQLLGDMGYAAYLQGRHAEAVTLYRRALAKDPKNAALKNNLGLALGRQGKFNEAFDAFRQAGGEAQATSNLAYLHAQHGHVDRAQAMYSRALTLNNKLRPAAEGLVQVARYKETESVTASDRPAPEARKPASKSVAAAAPPPSRAVPAAHREPVVASDAAASDEGESPSADGGPAANERPAPSERKSASPPASPAIADRPEPRPSPVRPRLMGRPRSAASSAQDSPAKPAPAPVVEAEKPTPPKRISLLVHDGDRAEVIAPSQAAADADAKSPAVASKAAAKPAPRTSQPADARPAPRAGTARSTAEKTTQPPTAEKTADEPQRNRSNWTGTIGASHRVPSERPTASPAPPSKPTPLAGDAKPAPQAIEASEKSPGAKDAAAAKSSPPPRDEKAGRPVAPPASSAAATRRPASKPSEPAKPKSLDELMASMQEADREAQPPRLPPVAYERAPAKAAAAPISEAPRKPFPVTQRQQQDQRQSEQAQSAPRKKQPPQRRVPLFAKSDQGKSAAGEIARADEQPTGDEDGRSQPAERAAASQGTKALNRQSSSLAAGRTSHGDRGDVPAADPQAPRRPPERTASRQQPGAIDRARSWLDRVIAGD